MTDEKCDFDKLLDGTCPKCGVKGVIQDIEIWRKLPSGGEVNTHNAMFCMLCRRVFDVDGNEVTK